MSFLAMQVLVNTIVSVGFVVLVLVVLLLISLKSLIHQCPPNVVLIFAGGRSRSGEKRLGYRVVKDGIGVCKPFIEKVYTMDLTNMIIELSASNAYAKGGVPVHVLGVANVKIASHEPLLHNAVERFLTKGRAELMTISKATLEGSLRGVLATLTPEQLNNDRALFEERLVTEVEQDMSALGLIVDTLKIQNISDDVKYLDSVGRIRSAELQSQARIAEARNEADSAVNSAENMERETLAKIEAEIQMARAEGERALQDAVTRRAAVVAEEEAAVAALVAKAQADVAVQQARIEQTRKQLEADVIQPAKAACEAAEQQAAAAVAPIIEDGKARAASLERLAESWNAAGGQAREIFLLQKMESVIDQITNTIGSPTIDKITIIDPKISGSGSGMDAGKMMAMASQIKEVFGIDVIDKIQKFGEKPAPAAEVIEIRPTPYEPMTTPPPINPQ